MLFTEFQYIPCYGLSKSLHLFCSFCINFNTSHVTVYRRSHAKPHPCQNYFNTSHVTVYHYSPHWLQGTLHISIHPMLRFIRMRCLFLSNKCYFNTSHVTVYPQILTAHITRSTISIHPMLRFIGCWKIRRTYESKISIHPMLRFI